MKSDRDLLREWLAETEHRLGSLIPETPAPPSPGASPCTPPAGRGTYTHGSADAGLSPQNNPITPGCGASYNGEQA